MFGSPGWKSWCSMLGLIPSEPRSQGSEAHSTDCRVSLCQVIQFTHEFFVKLQGFLERSSQLSEVTDYLLYDSISIFRIHHLSPGVLAKSRWWAFDRSSVVRFGVPPSDADRLSAIAARPAAASHPRESGQRRLVLLLRSIYCGTFSGTERLISRISYLYSIAYKIFVAEREGFEPSLEFPLNTLSKRAP